MMVQMWLVKIMKSGVEMVHTELRVTLARKIITQKNTGHYVREFRCNMLTVSLGFMPRWLLMAAFGLCLTRRKRKIATNKSFIIARTPKEMALTLLMDIGCAQALG